MRDAVCEKLQTKYFQELKGITGRKMIMDLAQIGFTYVRIMFFGIYPRVYDRKQGESIYTWAPRLGATLAAGHHFLGTRVTFQGVQKKRMFWQPCNRMTQYPGFRNRDMGSSCYTVAKTYAIL